MYSYRSDRTVWQNLPPPKNFLLGSRRIPWPGRIGVGGHVPPPVATPLVFVIVDPTIYTTDLEVDFLWFIIPAGTSPHTSGNSASSKLKPAPDQFSRREMQNFMFIKIVKCSK